MIIAAIVLAVLVGDLVLAVGLGQLLRRASSRCLPAVGMDNDWSKACPRPVPAGISV